MRTALDLPSQPSEGRAPEPVPSRAGVDLDVVIPVHNEQATLERSVRRLHSFLATDLHCTSRIVVADNASTDGTQAITAALVDELADVTSLRLECKGRGRALRAAWSASDATVVSYMDADLSTGLHCLAPLVAPLLSGHADVAIGTRLAPDATVTRGLKRELISRSYNHLLRVTLRAGFSDAQCGFKAVRRHVLDELLADTRDQGWFFDTELLVGAERHGLRIHELPVDWVDDSDSSVAIVPTALADLRGVARLVRDGHGRGRSGVGARAAASIMQTGSAEPRR
jgi:glycosyltransferase involved in cell wall biosynthesis